MEVKVFIHNFREAFGVTADLPFVFWYSDNPISEDIDKINGCFFKSFDKLKEGEQISLSSERIGCMGGKFYTGFSEMHERIPNFVSLNEYITPNVPLVSLTNVPDISLLNVPLFTGCN